MTELMRTNLRSVVQNAVDAHAGLLIQRGLSDWETGEKSIKAKLVDKVASVQPSELYQLAFERWLAQTYGPADETKTTPQGDTHYMTWTGRLTHRLYTGLSLGGALETGVATHHTYGMPLLAGSAIKGAVRAYAEQLFTVHSPTGKPEGDQAILEVLFGRVGNDSPDNISAEDNVQSSDKGSSAGYIVWHDAWWVPSATKPFVGEVVTVHHQAYYNGDMTEALDIESPVPNQQIAVQGEFYFVVEAEEKWAKYAIKLLQDAMTNAGMGAKTASGYGYFDVAKDALKKPLDKIAKAEAAAQAAAEAEKLAKEMANMTPLEAELKKCIVEGQWQVKKPDISTNFTASILDWLDKLEAHPDETSAILSFLEIAKIHYPEQIAKPHKIKKTNQKAWVDRLLALVP